MLFAQKKPASQQPTITKTTVEPPKKTDIVDSSTDSKNNKKKSTQSEDELEALFKKALEGTDEAIASQENRGEVSWGWQIMKTFLVLFFLIGFFWFVWRLYMFKKKLPSKESKIMQTLYRYNLSTNQQIQIVALSENLLILGVSDSGINLISEISDKNTINQIRLDCDKENSEEKPDFLWELTKTLKERFSGWSSPQKNILGNTAEMGNQTWSELRQNSKLKIQKLKEQKKIFSQE